MAQQHPDPFPFGAPAARTLADALQATGSERFGASLLNHLHASCGADYCAVFRLGGSAPSELATGSHDGSATAHARVSAYLARGLWSRDPAMVYAQSHLPADKFLLMRVDLRQFEDTGVREIVWPRIRDRVVVAGRSRRAAYSMSILREGRGGFSAAEMERMASSAELLIALLDKHADLSAEAGGAAGLLASLPAIEACIAALSPLTRREAEVCARILYGMSAAGIALDLGVGGETVKTFRKLAYRRLGIGTGRELLSWYLGLQARWRALQAEGG